MIAILLVLFALCVFNVWAVYELAGKLKKLESYPPGRLKRGLDLAFDTLVDQQNQINDLYRIWGLARGQKTR